MPSFAARAPGKASRSSGQMSRPSILPESENPGRCGSITPFDRRLAEVVAAEGPLQLAVLPGRGRERQVDVPQRQRAGRVLRGVEDLHRAVLDRHLRRPLAQFRQRQQLGRAPAPVGPAGGVQREAANRHLRHFQLVGQQVLQVGAATQEALVVGEQLGAGPSAARSRIDTPRISIPSFLTSVAERTVTFKPGYCFAKSACTRLRIRSSRWR